jgi:hypothetical protein
LIAFEALGNRELRPTGSLAEYQPDLQHGLSERGAEREGEGGRAVQLACEALRGGIADGLVHAYDGVEVTHGCGGVFGGLARVEDRQADAPLLRLRSVANSSVVSTRASPSLSSMARPAASLWPEKWTTSGLTSLRRCSRSAGWASTAYSKRRASRWSAKRTFCWEVFERPKSR